MTKSEILESIQLRQSTVKDFINCSLMFRFRHLDKIPPEYRNPAALHGSTLHKLIYLIHQDKWNLDVKRYYREIFEEFEFGNGSESQIPVRWENRAKDLTAFEENAVEIIAGYQNKPENHDCLVLYSEQPFRVRIAGHTFTGTIDQVRKNSDNTLELIDFKSGKQQPCKTALRNDWQLSLYSYALHHGEFEIAGEWFKPELIANYASIYFLRAHEIRKKASSLGPVGAEKGDPLLRVKPDTRNHRQFREQIKRLLNAILKDWHFPNPSHCHICQYTGHCLSRHQELPKKLITQAKQRLREVQLVG
jgi:RecB family exonuclease